MKFFYFVFTSLICALMLSACSDGGGSSRDIEIAFKAFINGDQFNCGSQYEGIGSTRSTINPLDMRFYVSNLKLIDESGSARSVQLANDGVWQHSGLALLDFEDASAGCAEEGTAALNTTIRGKVKDGTYSGISFTMGVPFEKNHIDSATATAPQNLSAMWWNWNAGFKFLKFDFASSGFSAGWRVHLGSTGCSGNDAGAVNECANPNRVEVNLTDFNPDTNSVAIELGALVEGANVDQNTAETAPGCMSGPTDPECSSLFEKLGLKGSEQQIFYVD